VEIGMGILKSSILGALYITHLAAASDGSFGTV
jgi:hypothetical protein